MKSCLGTKTNSAAPILPGRIQPGQTVQAELEHMIKERHRPTNAEHRNDGADIDRKKAVRCCQTDHQRDCHIQNIKDVLRQAGGLSRGIRDHMYDAVAGRRDQPGIQHHGSAEAGQDHRDDQDHEAEGNTR